jgi:hypothetical protein
MRLIPIDDPADPRVGPYRDIRERDLVGREGRFIAEGRVVLDTLLASERFAAESVLVLRNRLAGLDAGGCGPTAGCLASPCSRARPRRHCQP